MVRRYFLVICFALVVLSPIVALADSIIDVFEYDSSGNFLKEYTYTPPKIGRNYFEKTGNADIELFHDTSDPTGDADRIIIKNLASNTGIQTSRLEITLSNDKKTISSSGGVEHLNSQGAIVSTTVAGTETQTIDGPAPISAPKTTKTVCPKDGPHGLIDPNCTLAENLNHLYPIAVRIIVLLAFLAVIYAGYLYITSFGKEERITEAKNWVIAAIGGLALILLVPVVLDTLDIIKKELPTPTGTSNPASAVPATSSNSSSGADSSGANTLKNASDGAISTPAPTSCIPQGSIESGGFSSSGVPC